MADKNTPIHPEGSKTNQSNTGRWRLPLPFGRNGHSNGHENGNGNDHASRPLGRGQNGGRRYAHLVGWGMAVPERVLTNHDLEAIVETNDEWIKSRTGIAERRIAGEDESTGHLALQAARKAIEVAGILPSDIDLVIIATSTPEHIFPSTASLVQDWLGASRAGAYDLSAACSGFVYALDMASAKIRAGDLDTVLVIGAETMSRVMNWTDRGTCILFGDGAGAVVLQASYEPGGILSSILRSDGSGWDMLGVPTVGSRDTYLQAQKQLTGEEDEPPHLMHRLHMNGREVFRFATRVVNDSIKEAVRIAGLELEDVDLIVPHQANQRIIEAAARGLKMPIEKLYSNVERYGNTSAASIPIALCEAIEEGALNEGDHLVICGFGGGLTWATMVIRWEATPAEPQRMIGIRRQATYWYAVQRRNVLRRWRTISSRLGAAPTTYPADSRQRQDRRESEKEKS